MILRRINRDSSSDIYGNIDKDVLYGSESMARYRPQTPSPVYSEVGMGGASSMIRVNE